MSNSNKNSNKRRGNLTIYIFPYLFIDKEIELSGYKLKPSYTSIVAKESSRVRGHLKKIAKSFKLRNTNFINQYTFGWTTIHDKADWVKLKTFLDKFSTTLRYQELSDDKSGSNYTNFDYAVFEINRPMSTRKFEYYQGVFNGKSTIQISYPETKFCPNFDIRPHLVTVEGKSDVFNHMFHFSGIYHSGDEIARYLRAFDWFNRSFKVDPEVDDLERFTSLAVAFEALFNSPSEAIQATLSSNIMALLGETPEMNHWVKNFYEQRSKIVHGKEEPNTLYRGRNSTDEHLNHISFARKIFTRCVRAIFISREQVYAKDLQDELISNESRLKEIAEKIKGRKTIKELYESGCLHVVEALSQRDGSGKSADVIEIGKKLLPMAIPIVKKEKKPGLLKFIEGITSNSGLDKGELAVKYSDFHNDFSSIYFGDMHKVESNISLLVLKGAIYNFTSYACWKLFRDAFSR
ncbi:MAG TPA: HEPN domain-containing protein [Candidatus Woesebacteria bacterium]|nr:HEPN domain-containing protein [Candidatus Woesebacteria bacterium]